MLNTYLMSLIVSEQLTANMWNCKSPMEVVVTTLIINQLSPLFMMLITIFFTQKFIGKEEYQIVEVSIIHHLKKLEVNKL